LANINHPDCSTSIFCGTKRIKSLGADLANTIKSFRKTMDEEDKDKDK